MGRTNMITKTKMAGLNHRTLCQVWFLVIISFCGNLQAQHRGNWVPDYYFGIPEQDIKPVFFDEFEDNRHRWNLESDRLMMDLKGGELVLECPSNNTFCKQRLIQFDQFGNYEIEVSIRFIKGSENSFTGLSFGRDFSGNDYNFYFTPTGKFRIYKYERNQYTNITDWTYNSLLSKHAHNTLTVRKIGNRWYFFINQEKVAESQAFPLFGRNFGFTVGGNMAVEVDYLKVSELRATDQQGPNISILSPVLNNSQIAEFTQSNETIRCRISDASGVAEAKINNIPIEVSPDGYIEASIGQIPHGYTTIVVDAKDNFGNIASKEFKIYYEDKFADNSTATNIYLPRQNYTKDRDVYEEPARTHDGKNYLLAIGINEYTHWSRLHNAVRDGSDLKDLLSAEYDFDLQNVYTLFDKSATRENILETLEILQERIGEDDNLLIYYAGHGYYDSQADLGYWVPTEARLNKISDFIRNSTIRDYLATIKSKHILLVADACYAGSLFSSSRGDIMPNMKSRWAFTSGDIEKVWDGQPGQNSPFARYLLNFLRNNHKKYLPADELISQVKRVVERNTAQTPIGSPLKNVGDEGGVFIFRRK